MERLFLCRKELYKNNIPLTLISPNTMKHKVTTLFSILLTLLLAGCGDGNIRLKGKVTFSDDDSPLEAGVVMFDNGTINASGNINPDGTYTVGMLRNNDGLPPGDYRVLISGAARLLPCPENEDDDPENDIYPPPMERLIDRRYESYDTSGLSIKVDSSTKLYDISVDRP